jgi:competence protein ComFA
MKANVYAIQIGCSMELRISINLHIDLLFWFSKYRGNATIICMGPNFSFGQALDFREKLMRAIKLGKKQAISITHKNPYHFQHSSKFKLNRYLMKNYFTLSGTCVDITSKTITYSEWIAFKQTIPEIKAHDLQLMLQAIQGRSLLFIEAVQLCNHIGIFQSSEDAKSYIQYAYLCGNIELKSGIVMTRRRFWRSFWKKELQLECQRCGSPLSHMHHTQCMYCESTCFYCEACLTMGKNRFCSILIYGNRKNEQNNKNSTPERQLKQPTNFLNEMNQIAESFGLSPAQKSASLEGLKFMVSMDRSFLIWAVTGAGKTEMIFPFIDFELKRKGKVLIASPRKDVVLELLPRVQKAFERHKVIALFGGSEHRYEQAEITIATTHQLFRFHKAFDLAIIDEMDAFPYHNNPMLAYAANRVITNRGHYILLTATPPRQLQKDVNSGKLPHVKVPVRFHRYPLPIPQFIKSLKLKEILQKRDFPHKIMGKLLHSIRRGAQVFVFVPAIIYVQLLVEMLRKAFEMEGHILGADEIEGTSSKDSERSQKVNRFRNKQIRLLVTTTILERGVTIAFSDVYIFDSDASYFEEAALVQMAGRAGRSKDDPFGKVYFISAEVTKAQTDAIKQMKSMNQCAKMKGYLIDNDMKKKD